jgi:hypothetical protein
MRLFQITHRLVIVTVFYFYLKAVVNELTEIFSVDLCRLNTHTLLPRHSFWLTGLSVHVPRPGNFNDCINFGD